MEDFSLDIGTSDVGVRTFALSSCGNFLALVNDNAELMVHKLHRGLSASRYDAYDNVFRDSGIVQKQIVLDHVRVGCQLSWHPTQPLLAVPSSQGSISLVKSADSGGTSWTDTSLVGLPPLCPGDQPLNLVAFSPCGRFIASADLIGRIVLWDVALKDPIHAVTALPSGPLVSVCWGGVDGDSVLVVTETHFGTFSHGQNFLIVNKTKPSSTVATTVASAAERSNMVVSDSTSVSTLVSREKEKGTVRGIGKERSVEAPAAIHVDDAYVADTSFNDGDDDNDDDDEDDVDDEMVEVSALHSSVVVQKCAAFLEDLVQQAAFQPSSTHRDDKGRRYLVWNAIGSIVSREDGMTNRVEIKFANIDGNNKPEAFPDNYGFTKAALSYEGAFFASDAEDVDSDSVLRRGSTVYYHAFPNQRHLGEANESFTITLPHGEEAVAVTVGSGWAAVASSMQYLRIFSSTGLQLLVSFVKGPVVSLVGCADKLAIFYYEGDNNKLLRVDMLTIHTDGSMRQIVDSIVPLPRSTLSWTGFEVETGTLFMMNSKGMLSSLMNIAGWRWVPVLDGSLKKSVDQSFWPIAVKTDRLCYVLLNGESQPAIHPQPVIATKHFKIPICESKEGKDRGEIQNERSRSMLWQSLKSSNYTEQLKTSESFRISCGYLDPDTLSSLVAEADKSVLVLFQEACKAQRIPIAIDLCRRLVTEKAMWSGITIANYFGRTHLASMLQDLLEKRSMDSVRTTRAYEVREDIHSYKEPRHEISDVGQRPTMPATELVGEGLGLSKKLSGRSVFDTPVTKKIGKENDGDTDREIESETKLSKATNPFARSSPLSPPLKRKNVFENVKDLKASPSPKKAVLSV